jgi:hypothetical protein
MIRLFITAKDSCELEADVPLSVQLGGWRFIERRSPT